MKPVAYLQKKTVETALILQESTAQLLSFLNTF